MPQRILVPLEGGPGDAEALAVARQIAHQLSAAVILIHVAPIQFDTKDLIATEQRLDSIAQELRTEGIEAHFLLEYGDPSAEIARAGEEQQAQMIILTPERRALLQRLLDPRVSRGLLGSSAIPLVILPDAGSENSVDELLREPDAKVVAALDGSASAEAALAIAIELARVYGRRLLLVRVVPPVFILGSGVEAMNARHDAQYAEEVEAHCYLVATRERLEREENISAETLELVGPVADQLTHLVRAHPGSLLVMGTRGHGGLARVILGSVAAQVMSRATTPVVIVPPRPVDEAEERRTR